MEVRRRSTLFTKSKHFPPSIYLPASNLLVEDCREFAAAAIKASRGIITDKLIIPQLLTDAGIYSRFGVKGQCLFLIRPDGYVAFRCEPLDMDMLMGFMQSRLGAAVFSKQCIEFKHRERDWVPFAIAIGIVSLLSYTLKKALLH